MLGQSIEVPSLGGHGKLYLEAATQYRQLPGRSRRRTGDRQRPLRGAVARRRAPDDDARGQEQPQLLSRSPRRIDLNRAPEFNVVTYSFVPPAETPTILDTEFGYFNACVNGGRLRADVRANDSLLVYGQGIFAAHEERAGERRVRRARTLDVAAAGRGGGEPRLGWALRLRVDLRRRPVARRSCPAGSGRTTRAPGTSSTASRHVEYSIAKSLTGPYSIEVAGFHRLRREVDQNAYPTPGTYRWWHEGQNYVSLRVAPRWVFTQGFEYTTLSGYPTYYLNGSVFYTLHERLEPSPLRGPGARRVPVRHRASAASSPPSRARGPS